ncbi:hypothetical protein I2I05_10560 [Hymenobacter sp. BT683]|uniref:Uncharacterized protein n=1 Tax=Hymenobacter jeongseonensis TaxID=2791027 RepID=A0ABS0IHM3_9BACT|nr:hypothetical protein [Hymenobacter jeongseonensis]MBF9237836.1 hypothetical protein [Hymenobacter jeongseonensis]
MNKFLPYQSFASEIVAQPLLELLERHSFPVETGWAKPDFDVSMANNATDTRFVVRLHQADFERAHQVEDEENEALIVHAAPDHYLFSFSDEELFDILVKPDEWNSYDVSLARHILRQRGREVSPDTVQLLRRHRVAEMAKPEPSQKAWIMAGYLFAVFGGIVGMLIGWHLHNHKKPLPDGTQVLAFSALDRAHGFRILLLGLFGLLLSILGQVVGTDGQL